MRKATRPSPEELPPDNSARLAIFDAMHAVTAEGPNGVTRTELAQRVIGRLRVLVPQELHVMGEERYIDEKVEVCLDHGLIVRKGSDLLELGESKPYIRYPDGTLRLYTPGLEAARERLKQDELRLRQSGFTVRHVIKSPATKRKSEDFRRLVASMNEHGFLGQYPLIESATAGVIDGLARQAAAVEAGIVLKNHHIVRLPRHRDTILQHALLVLDVNAQRLSEEEHAGLLDVIADRAKRPWIEIAADLELTQDWRRTEPRKYDAKLEVDLLPYGNGDEPKVQVTTDGTRVMLRSLMQQAGVPEYDRDLLKPFVVMEKARTQFSGRQAIFVGVQDAIDGIAKMQRDRVRNGLKVDTAWSEMRQWLLDTLGTPGSGATPEAPESGREIGGEEPAPG